MLRLTATGMGVTSPMQNWVLIEHGHSPTHHPFGSGCYESQVGGLDAPLFLAAGAAQGHSFRRNAERQLAIQATTFRERGL